MVRTCPFFVFVLFLLSVISVAKEPEISLAINPITATPQNPIEVIVTISRDAGVEVDSTSFLLESKPIEVQHLSDSRQSSYFNINGKTTQENLVISKYQFFLPGKEAGLFVVPALTVKVGSNVYQSKPFSYEITKSKNSSSLRLEVSVEGNSPLYPGQHAKFIYRIFFKENIQTTQEQLPLLEATGFRKIGSKQIRSYVEGNYHVQEIIQEVAAQEPGEFNFGRSIIEGYAYQEDFFGRKRYIQPALRSEAEPVKIQVSAFPAANKPPFFNGAVGFFNLDVKMTSPTEVSVGDKITLAITFLGIGDLDTIQLTPKIYQEKFSPSFRFSDLPPRTEMGKNFKKFIVEMRPLTDNVKEIPAIEFAFYDPNKHQYFTLKSDPIPIKVNPIQELSRPIQTEFNQQTGSVKEVQPDKNWQEELNETSKIEIAGNYPLIFNQVEQKIKPWRTWKVMWIIPIGLIFLWTQFQLKRFMNRRRKMSKPTRSFDLLKQALSHKNSSVGNEGLVEKALLLRLVEKGYIPENATLETIPKEGIAGEVYYFLAAQHEKRFGKGSVKLSSDVNQAQELFDKI